MLKLSDLLQVSLGVLGTLINLIMKFLLDYFSDVLQFSLTGEGREKGEEQEDVDSCHQPAWLALSCQPLALESRGRTGQARRPQDYF